MAGKAIYGKGAFFSPLDEVHLWAAVRYVERNPVRAGMVGRAEDFRWSSAATHCGKGPDGLLNLESAWSKQFSERDDWAAWLADGDEAEAIQVLRQNIEKGLPCGSAGFVERLGELAGRVLEYRPRGRPKGRSAKG